MQTVGGMDCTSETVYNKNSSRRPYNNIGYGDCATIEV